MSALLRVRVQVQEGHRLEIVDSLLNVGDWVEVSVSIPRVTAPLRREDLAAFLRSLPPSTRTEDEWKAREAELEAERNSWDRT